MPIFFYYASVWCLVLNDFFLDCEAYISPISDAVSLVSLGDAGSEAEKVETWNCIIVEKKNASYMF